MSAARHVPRQTAPERVRNLRIAQQRRGACDRRRVVRREIVPIVLELEQVEPLDQAGGRVAGNQIHLSGGERAIAERQVHDARRIRKSQAVGLGQARIAVRPLDELVAEAGAPLRRHARRIVDRPQTAATARPLPRTRIANVLLKPSGGSSVRPASRVQRAHGLEDRARVVADRLMEDRRQRGARVFDVDVDVAA